jgi:hypothetical protein
MNTRNYRDLAYLPIPATDPGITIIKAPVASRRSAWDIFIDSDNNGNEVIKVYPGIISGVLPQNILDDFRFSKNKTNYIVAGIKGGAKGNVSECTIRVESKSPTPPKPTESAPPSTFDIVVGIVDADKNVYSLFSGASINLRAQEVFRQQIKVSNFFEVPFKSFYTWVLG